jgi:hypothetical protein
LGEADRCSDVHERVMPPRPFALGAEARVERYRFAIGGEATK